MKARLFAPFGPLAGLDLTTDTAVTLGSGRDNVVVVSGRTISKLHARLSPDPTSRDWLLEDLGSTNGTELDGTPVEGCERLRGLHVIDLAGVATLFFLPLGEEDASTTAAPRSTVPLDSPRAQLAAQRPAPPAAAAPLPKSPARREIHLEVRARGQLLRRYTLKEGRNLVGRSVLADVRLERDDISREHAMIEVTRQAISVEDLGSTNGTFVDGKAAEQAIVVSEQSDIRFGGVRAKVMVALLD